MSSSQDSIIDSIKEENNDQNKSYLHKFIEGSRSRAEQIRSQFENGDKKVLVMITAGCASLGLLGVLAQRNIYFSRLMRNMHQYRLSIPGMMVAGIGWLIYTHIQE